MEQSQTSDEVSLRIIYLSALLLTVLVFLSRYFTGGPVYMVDGPRFVSAILARTYVIQPPGYWLYARAAGFFPTPATGLATLNQAFSALGCGVLFLVCHRLGCTLAVCWLAALSYASVFYLWFAGDIHSSYASQVLFPILMLFCFLLYRDKPTTLRLIAIAAAFSVGAGLRPSDGAFLVPLYIYLALRFVKPTRERLLLLLLTAALCLAWYIPTQHALHSAQMRSYAAQMDDITTGRSMLLSGVNKGTVRNVVRLILPLLAGFWMFLPAWRAGVDPQIKKIALFWCVPGIAFFALVYMADSDYLVYLTGAIILIGATLRNQRTARVVLLVCFVWNAGLFLFSRPLASSGNGEQMVNFYVIKYCHYGISHRWTSTLGAGGVVPR